jgi:hypothetical protein
MIISRASTVQHLKIESKTGGRTTGGQKTKPVPSEPATSGGGPRGCQVMWRSWGICQLVRDRGPSVGSCELI